MSKSENPEFTVACMVRQPELLREVYRRLGWVDRAALLLVRAEIDAEVTRQEMLVGACREGVFGRD